MPRFERRSRTTVSRRMIMASAATIIGTGLLSVSCGSDATPASPASSKSAPFPEKLVFWPEGGETNASYKAWVARIADFEKAYPKTKVEMTDTPDRDAKLVTVVAAGTPPDVSVFDRYTIFGASQTKLFMDMGAMAKTAGIKGDDHQPWCWDEVWRDGKLWGMPYSTDTRMIYVNAEHLKKAGIPATAPKTLDDFDKIARQLNVGVPGNIQRLGFVPWGSWNNWRLYGWGWIFGGDWYDPKANQVTMDKAQNIAALEWEIARAGELGGYAPVEAFRKAQQSNVPMDMFKAGFLSTIINSNSQLSGMFAKKDMEWIVWPIPPATGTTRSHTWSGGYATVLPAGVKSPDASFMLAKYLSDDVFQLVQSQTGGGRLPTIKKVAADPYWNSVDGRVKQFIEQLPNSHIRPPIVQIPILNAQLDGPDGAETLALQGKGSAKELLAQASQRVNAAIKEGRAS